MPCDPEEETSAFCPPRPWKSLARLVVNGDWLTQRALDTRLHVCSFDLCSRSQSRQVSPFLKVRKPRHKKVKYLSLAKGRVGIHSPAAWH